MIYLILALTTPSCALTLPFDEAPDLIRPAFFHSRLRIFHVIEAIEYVLEGAFCILKVFVLCRDYANTPPTIRFEFPERYEEPDVVLQLPGQGGGNDGEDAESEEGQGGGEAQPTNP